MLTNEQSRIPLLKTLHFEEGNALLRKLIAARSSLATLNEATRSLPNPDIIIGSIGLREAQSSSEIENIVTTSDRFFQAEFETAVDPQTKEVRRYGAALTEGFRRLTVSNVIRLSDIEAVQIILLGHSEGFRSTPGTQLLNDFTGEIVWEPPQNPEETTALLTDFQFFINTPHPTLDPITQMAIAHHQFECIHPFGDGNGRTGRILNILLLIQCGLLRLPVIYLSRAILARKSEYYKLLRATQESWDYSEWCFFIAEAVEATANDSRNMILEIMAAMEEFEQRIQQSAKSYYSHELIQLLFSNPFITINSTSTTLEITRQTASKRLQKLETIGLLSTLQHGNQRIFVNNTLLNILSSSNSPPVRG